MERENNKLGEAGVGAGGGGGRRCARYYVPVHWSSVKWKNNTMIRDVTKRALPMNKHIYASGK